MKVAEYVTDFLIKNSVTDVFGIPGSVVLDLLYALDEKKGINVHLSYHEQSAAFEACGYAQANYTLGVAYATRGPGFTNLITGIADAYADSIPVLFITAHSGKTTGHYLRFEQEQEIDTVQMVKYITKYSSVVEEVSEVPEKIQTAYNQAMSGRKGPALLDFSAELWNKDIENTKTLLTKIYAENRYLKITKIISDFFRYAKRPIFLLGDGVRQAGALRQLVKLVDKLKIPVLTSRCAQDVGSSCQNYFGYIGSHGIRYSNFIFSKADLVIVLGNRMAFPIKSESFLKALENKKIIRFEIDKSELLRDIPNTISYEISLNDALQILEKIKVEKQEQEKWLDVCRCLKYKLKTVDMNQIIYSINNLLNITPKPYTIVTDVGNNEFWVSRAYELSGVKNRIMYSKSFGTLGCALGKAIGAYYALRSPVICIAGDQGIQLNIQELQFIAKEQLPIIIFIINNLSSGMIKDHENQKFDGIFVHTTKESGFGSPQYELIAKGYGIRYKKFDTKCNLKEILDKLNKPIIIEGIFDETIELEPNLPYGQLMQNMIPVLNDSLYEKLEQL